MLGRQFTGDSFKVSGGGERRPDHHSQIVGITNKKSCGEKKLSDGETVARSQQGFGWLLFSYIQIIIIMTVLY